MWLGSLTFGQGTLPACPEWLGPSKWQPRVEVTGDAHYRLAEAAKDRVVACADLCITNPNLKMAGLSLVRTRPSAPRQRVLEGLGLECLSPLTAKMTAKPADLSGLKHTILEPRC
jgi:hypothetical protein